MRDSELDGQYEQALGQPVSMSNHPEQWTVGTSKTPRVSASPNPGVTKDENE